jgi:FkbM family methyltransferase
MSTAVAEFNQLKVCRDGLMLFNGHDTVVGRSLSLYGEWAFEECRMMAKYIPAEGTVVDVDAYIGTHSLFFSRLVQRAGRVYAFEPQRIVFQTLNANLALNSVTNVHTFPKTIGPSVGSAYIALVDYTQPMNFASLQCTSEPMGEHVSQVTIDSLYLPACHFIRMRQGRPGVLQGAGHTLATERPVVYFGEPWNPTDLQTMLVLLEQYDYLVYRHTVDPFNPENFCDQSKNIFEGARITNYLAVPRHSWFAQDPLFQHLLENPF